MLLDFLKSTIRSWVHDHNIFLSFTKPFFSPSEPISVYLPPYGPHLCMSSQFSFYTIQVWSPFLSFLLFSSSLPFLSLSLYIWLPWEQSGPLQRACVTWHHSHQRHQQGLQQIESERERVYSNTSSPNTVNRDWEIKREIKLGWDLLNLQTVYFKNMGNQKEKHQKLYFAYRIIKNSAYSGQFLHYEIIFD